MCPKHFIYFLLVCCILFKAHVHLLFCHLNQNHDKSLMHENDAEMNLLSFTLFMLASIQDAMTWKRTVGQCIFRKCV